ncbi:MAG: DEAD/DEAH box helicase [Crocinitomicaceae bacterium]|nr:DEAD/DEAH box helicase [Crocinitomicaceae bacterium]|tara:strand:- start:1883 stop:3223 length:1341 start_codon:yes stop_codon:yes gene_type:complete
MNSFEFLPKSLKHAIDDLGFKEPTPIQRNANSVILAGKDVVGIAQTGTGKTFAYMLPILQQFKFSEQKHPKYLILVPTRELVLQVVDQINAFSKYMTVRTIGVYGGTNINTQKLKVAEGCDILVATPGRLYDLVVSRALQLKEVKKLIIDEVDVMMDLGFRFQLNNIFDLLPNKRQNIMFSATMTDDVSIIIDDFFTKPEKISIAVSGTPLENIIQESYSVKNFYTKLNLLKHLLRDKETYEKVLVFVSSKKNADLIFEEISEQYLNESCIIHSNKSQNYRIRSITQFEEGENRILIATDIMARGLDIENISHVINFDVPSFPENYMHRIGRTGRAEKKGNSILMFTENEIAYKNAIEDLMSIKIKKQKLPSGIVISNELAPDEKPRITGHYNAGSKIKELNQAFHKKSEKNSKTNQGGSYRRKLAIKYKKPKTRGDKNFNRRKKK